MGLLQEEQNESLPPNTSWPDVLEEKLTPSEDTTGKWVASTTSFERKGLRFGMESSPASAEVKGSRQTEKKTRETEDRRREWRGRRGHQNTTTREEEHAETSPGSTHVGWRGWREGSSLPPHAVATGSPVEPDFMEGWKVDCRSKRSPSIFTALQTERKTEHGVF